MNTISLAKDKNTPLLALIRLMRVRHWIKNFFVLAPLIFSGEFLNIASVQQSLLAMLYFCIASSSTYIINDIQDLEQDRKHSIKSKLRPLASGQIKLAQALWVLAGLYLVLFVAWFQQPSVLLIILAYLLLNMAYTFRLKHIPIIELFSVSMGFVLRVYAGAVALSVSASAWILITTLSLALYLTAIKRRQELRLAGPRSRKVLQLYSVELIDRYAEVAAIGALFFYALFVLTTRPDLAITIPLVIYGLFRYWFLVESFDDCESPTDALLGDWPLLWTIALWAGYCLWILWPNGGYKWI